jgi:hypothetical protein
MFFGSLQKEILAHSNKIMDEERIIELILEHTRREDNGFQTMLAGRTTSIAFGKKGIAKWDFKLLRSPEGISYFDGGRQKGP